MTSNPALDEIVLFFREHAGLRAKSALQLVTDVLGPTDWVSGPGDDAAALPDGDGSLLLAGEALWPPFVEKDPFAAGVAAVVTNVNDIAAMGGRPLGLVNTIVGPEAVARRALEGMRFASDLYGVPVVGGHLTVRECVPALSAFIAGRAAAPLSACSIAPNQVVLVACSLEGTMREDFPFFSSVLARGDRVRTDVDLLPRAAEAGLCVAAKDVSMAGLLGSLAMLLEGTGTGVAVDLARIPRPDGVTLVRWLAVFPSFTFLLACSEHQVEGCRRLFHQAGLACEAIGILDASAKLRARLDGDEALLMDLSQEGVTRLARRASERIR